MNEGTAIILFVLAFLAIGGFHTWRAITQGRPVDDTREVGWAAGFAVVRVIAGPGRTLVGVRVSVTEDALVVACMDARKAKRLARLLRNAARSRRGIPVGPS